jgi:hypothetical protein
VSTDWSGRSGATPTNWALADRRLAEAIDRPYFFRSIASPANFSCVSGASGVSGYELWAMCRMIGRMNSTTEATPNPAHLASRTGKIGRLPRAIRQQLNERLADGESAKTLVSWLNGCEVVQERLAEYYDSRPITEQNLSDWKQGGFQDWLWHQQARSMARDFLLQAEELSDEVGESTLAERTTEVVALALLQLFEAALKTESGPQQRQALLEIARELGRLRRGEHQRQRVQLLAERHRREVEAEEESREAEIERKRRAHLAVVRAFGSGYRSEYLLGLANRTLKIERATIIEDFFALNADDLEEVGIEPLPRKPKWWNAMLKQAGL